MGSGTMGPGLGADRHRGRRPVPAPETGRRRLGGGEGRHPGSHHRPFFAGHELSQGNPDFLTRIDQVGVLYNLTVGLENPRVLLGIAVVAFGDGR